MSTTLPPQAISSLLAGPAGKPPPGVEPNFINPPNEQHLDFPLVAVSSAIIMFSVCIRLFTRWYLSKKYAIEDYFILIAWALALSYNALCLVCILNGIGTHIWDQSLATYLQGTKWVNITAAVYNPTITFVKLAILTQFLRLFAPTYRTNRLMFIACWATIVMNVVFYTVHTIVDLAQCTPREKIWKPFIAGHCLDPIKIFLSSSLFNVITDFMILILPLPVILRLHMNIKKRLMIAGMFTAGIVACVASVARAYYTFQLFRTEDISWGTSRYGMCASYEMCMGILVFCLPVMPSFFRFVGEKMFRTQRSQQNKDSLEYIIPTSEPLQGARKTFAVPRHMGPNSSIGVSSVDQYLGRQDYSATLSAKNSTAHDAESNKKSEPSVRSLRGDSLNNFESHDGSHSVLYTFGR